MSGRVNLDAMIPRADFFEPPSKVLGDTQVLRITDLEPGITYEMICKPDFQRETVDWRPDQVVRLIETFCTSDIIPAVILWQSGARLFVIDGAHRLSALIAWIRGDYGAGEVSRKFFNNRIGAEQQRAHDQTAALVEQTVGTWAAFKDANRLVTLKDLRIQWIENQTPAQVAEAFIRINQGGTVISPLEERILRAKRSALAVATRVISRGATGHEYWKHFTDTQAAGRVPQYGREIYELLYDPPLTNPIKSLDVPLAGSGYGPQVLRFVFDLVALANELPIPDSTRSKAAKDTLADDETGKETVKYLNRTRELVRLVLSNHPSSLGLHPALYFYSSNGQFQPAALLNVAAWLSELKAKAQLDLFRHHRGAFEQLLLAHPQLIRPESHTLGSGARTRSKMVSLLHASLRLVSQNKGQESVWDQLLKEFPDQLKNTEPETESGQAGRPFSRRSKSAVFLADLPSAPKCPLCGGLMHMNGKTIDHEEKRAAGGSSSPANGRAVHPVCNSSRDKDQAQQAHLL